MSIDQDLARWDEGALTRDALEARHPGVDVDGLTVLRDRLTMLADIDAPDADEGWAALSASLPSRPRHVARIRRTLALAAAALVAMGTVAYATGFDPVRRGVDTVVDGVTGLFDGSDDPAPVPARDRPDIRSTIPADAVDDHGGNSGPGGDGDDGDSSGPSSSSGSGSDGDGDDDGSRSGSSGSSSSGSGSSGSGSGSDSSGSGSDDSSDDSSGSSSESGSSGSGSSGSGSGSDGADDDALDD